jgi:RNA polymerase sigma-70 factor (ECF subfamily)
MQDISSEILMKASQGDLAAFEQIYKASAGFVYNVAFRVVNSKEEAEEISQEVFLTVYHKLKTFRFEASLKTWIYRITVNCAINHSRKMMKEHKRTVEYDDNWVQGKTSVKGGMEMSSAYQEELVNSLLQTLNPDQKVCVILRSIEDLSYQEIADVLKININTVRSRLKRARETLLNLRKEVGENEM